MADDDYRKYLAEHLSAIEKFSQSFSSLDERLDWSNMLLTRILLRLGGIPPITTITPTITPSIIEFPPISALTINRESFITGQRNITTAGTAEQLITASIFVPDGFAVTVIAKPANTGYIYLGNTKGDAEGASRFDGLEAGVAISLRITNANLIWVDASVSGEGVSWVVEW